MRVRKIWCNGKGFATGHVWAGARATLPHNLGTDGCSQLLSCLTSCLPITIICSARLQDRQQEQGGCGAAGGAAHPGVCARTRGQVGPGPVCCGQGGAREARDTRAHKGAHCHSCLELYCGQLIMLTGLAALGPNWGQSAGMWGFVCIIHSCRVHFLRALGHGRHVQGLVMKT